MILPVNSLENTFLILRTSLLSLVVWSNKQFFVIFGFS